MPKKHLSIGLKIIAAVYASIIVVLVLLSISNYPVQWREQVNHERQRYLDVIAQALQYYASDHGGTLPALPSQPSMIANTNECKAYCPALSKDIPCVDLAKTLVPGYMKEMLLDPLSNSTTESRMYVQQSGDHVMLGACDTFFGQQVTVDKVIK